MLKLFGAMSNGKNKDDESDYGDDTFTEAKVKRSGLLDDIKALGPNLGKDALTLFEKVAGTGKLYDDRTFLVGWMVPRPLQCFEGSFPVPMTSIRGCCPYRDPQKFDSTLHRTHF